MNKFALACIWIGCLVVFSVLGCRDSCADWENPTFSASQDLGPVELERNPSPRFFEADTFSSDHFLGSYLEAEPGFDAYQWVIFKSGESDTILAGEGQRLKVESLPAPFDQYQDYQIELHTRKQTDRPDCSPDGWVTGYAEKRISVIDNGLFPTQLRGVYEGYTKGQRGTKLEVSIEPTVIFAAPGLVITYWFVQGLFSDCEKRIPIIVGHQAFSITEFSGWEFGCGGLRGWGELDSQQGELRVWYSYEEEGSGTREEFVFVGKKMP